ncbi:electron transport complex subunit RsxG [Reinekea thalattae]|uniref:Ion-translocating oxidoreductase complex subunit G n=1 Tax=Reinekea thalattae TaxID=2593301 RepID=A0A5C8Z852_9GAMM|nr:electron transport complex subunit RsxG [Reinekea thalattae]TXR53331.1 electron transport complex subunit RsxG [Reinekea thalattae]
MTEANTSMLKAIKNSAIGLGIFAFFTAGIIAITQQVTAKNITENQRQFEARQLLSLLPDGFKAEQILNSAQPLNATQLQQFELLNVSNGSPYYIAKNAAGQVQAIILPAQAPEGYTESIQLIIGLTAQGEVIGTRVTQHKETPGLGDQIERAKSDWILNFNGKSLNNPTPEQWLVKKDGGSFDQLTGATITPRAVVKAVKQTLTFYELNKASLLSENLAEGLTEGAAQ